MNLNNLRNKLNEALKSVLPVIAVVLVLAFTVAPMPNDMLLTFLFGGGMLIVGMTMFSLGVEMSMGPMGESIGSQMTRTKSIPVVVAVSLLLGVLITISEPDLQVLAGQVQSIPNKVLIWSVAGGVGLFLAVAVLRMLFSAPLKAVLFAAYAAVFALAYFAPVEFMAVAFDSGGVTTGPMTVPFIMSFGIGICAIRSDRKASDDSFGLVALCSAGPIIATLILSLIFNGDSSGYVQEVIPSTKYTVELGRLFTSSIPEYLKEIALALLPIVLFFSAFQIFSLRLERSRLVRILIGLFYTYSGVVIFLAGANVGFMPAGAYLGNVLAALSCRWVIIPIGMLIGFFIVKAEPAVQVLMAQVEELTNRKITGRALRISLSAGVACAVGLSMLRILCNIPIMYFVIPGYAISLLLSLFVPEIYTAIAFDSGGVASGPMTAAFLLPFAVGACSTVGGNIVEEAFGVVAMVAMTPLLTIQLLGLAGRMKQGKHIPENSSALTAESDCVVIEL